MKRSQISSTALVASVVLLSGCQTAYYSAMEKVGYDKREILVDRIKSARDEQEATKEQFEDALEQFASVVHIDGGQLEREYRKLKNAFESSEYRAEQVSNRIDQVEDVAGDLFYEWERELDEYENANLRRQSEDQLRQTKRRYESLLAAMKKAESRIEPVLSPMRDNVLFLKHNLNARAIASLQDELDGIELDVSHLIREMEEAIAEADAFIATIDS